MEIGRLEILSEPGIDVVEDKTQFPKFAPEERSRSFGADSHSPIHWCGTYCRRGWPHRSSRKVLVGRPFATRPPSSVYGAQCGRTLVLPDVKNTTVWKVAVKVASATNGQPVAFVVTLRLGSTSFGQVPFCSQKSAVEMPTGLLP